MYTGSEKPGKLNMFRKIARPLKSWDPFSYESSGCRRKFAYVPSPTGSPSMRQNVSRKPTTAFYVRHSFLTLFFHRRTNVLVRIRHIESHRCLRRRTNAPTANEVFTEVRNVIPTLVLFTAGARSCSASVIPIRSAIIIVARVLIIIALPRGINKTRNNDT